MLECTLTLTPRLPLTLTLTPRVDTSRVLSPRPRQPRRDREQTRDMRTIELELLYET